MPGASLFTLLDDIASVLDDVATLTKVAAKQTAGVLGDDLALNAQQVAGVRPERELPVVWKVAKGSLWNKAILVPGALAISAFAPWVVTPLLMLGGAFLCYEGVEKLVHKWLHPNEQGAHEAALAKAAASSEAEVLAVEKEKIAGAIRTDFILSAEIVIIALGTVAGEPLVTRVAVLAGIAALMTVGVYGLVAGIVKMDDVGTHLLRPRAGAPAPLVQRKVGTLLLKTAPLLMKTLSFAGTVAMFLVGGGILSHGVPLIALTFDAWAAHVKTIAGIGPALAVVAPMLFNATLGIIAGAVIVPLVLGVRRLFRKKA
ncbi:MAG: DUF808 domain-containing protein [Deltaproteobacteria bacterium]|nr:DUF808 domain-containing protein [Deltaproteobacteria bacterium]